MADPLGARLFVNLSASQARRRLKGFGHGVRKVQSAGRGRAVIIHTATGEHLSELQAKFADVGHASQDSELAEPIQNLRNIGTTTAGWLREAGIHTIDDLRRLGPTFAFRLVQQQQPRASLNLLWALAAGLADRDAGELAADEKQRLLADL